MSVPGLNSLANRLKGIHFPDDNKVLDDVFFERSKAGMIHGCYPLGPHGLYIVKFSLGGAVRHIGFSDCGADAARFADMARVRFFKYKLRGGHTPLVDQDLNFDLKQVDWDTKHVQDAVSLLSDIEHLLLDQGILKDYKEIEAEREGIVLRRREVRKTKGGEILFTLLEIQEKIEVANRRLAGIESRLTTVEGTTTALLSGNGRPND